ncbi:MAG: HAMP domain-containing histidine kinase [Phycisphaerae bacterium]|nr:HAMP domain-containing histidine kinase [Phycisphaerae bacterium]
MRDNAFALGHGSEFRYTVSTPPTPDPDPGSTQYEQLHARILRLQEELIAAQRLAMVGTTAAMLAHEFNNLMTPVLARTLDALSRDDHDVMRMTLERTVNQIQKAISLSRHLLKLTDMDSGVAETCTVLHAVDEALEEAVRPFKKDGIELHVDVPDDLRVNARSLLLEQVLLNLLTNAREAMKGCSGLLAISARRDGDFVHIAVRDSGKGLSQHEIETTYAPFLAADATDAQCAWQNVGLGLHVCRLITRQHGASVGVTANEVRGCTFHLRWPAA